MKLLIMDVNGTVCDSGQVIDEEMAEILAYQERNLAFISGKGKDDLYRILDPLLKRRRHVYVLPEMGRSAYHGDEQVYSTGIPFSDFVAGEVKGAVYTWLKGFGIRPFTRDVITTSGAQLTVSLLGASAPAEEKERFDPQKNVRRALVGRLEKLFPGLHCTIGGNASIDIHETEWNKRYGAGMFMSFMYYSPNEVTFYGDQLCPGGNDEPIKNTGALCISVNGPEHLKDLIRKDWLNTCKTS